MMWVGDMSQGNGQDKMDMEKVEGEKQKQHVQRRQ
jgi:hypothetical protein